MQSGHVQNRGTIVAVALVAALTWGCRHAPDSPPDVTVSEPAEQQSADSAAEADPRGGTESAGDRPERSVRQVEEQLDGRPPAPNVDRSGDTEDTPSVPTAPEDVSEQMARNFAAAYIEIVDLKRQYERRLDEISDDGKIRRLRERLRDKTNEALQSRDLSIGQFNAIATLLGRDDAFRERIQSRVDSLAP